MNEMTECDENEEEKTIMRNCLFAIWHLARRALWNGTALEAMSVVGRSRRPMKSCGN